MSIRLVRWGLLWLGMFGLLGFAPAAPAVAAGPSSTCASSAQKAQSESPLACCVRNDYSVTATDVRMPFPGVNILVNGPGPAESTYTRSISSTVSYQVTVGAESEVGAVLAKAKVSISGTIGGSNTTNTTNSVKLTAPAGKYAHGQYVSYGKSVSWRKYRVNASCTTSTLASGRINFPTNKEGWYTWVSSTP